MTNEFQHSFQVPIHTSDGAVAHLEIAMQIKLPQLQVTSVTPPAETANAATQTCELDQQQRYAETIDRTGEQKEDVQSSYVPVQPVQQGIFQVVDRTTQQVPPVQSINDGTAIMASVKSVGSNQPKNDETPSESHTTTSRIEQQAVPAGLHTEATQESVAEEEQAPETSIAKEAVEEEPIEEEAIPEPPIAASGPETGSSASVDQFKPIAQSSDEDSPEEEDNEVTVKLSEKQADPSNPLHSARDFSDLDLKPALLRGLTSLNFRKPSAIQEKALPLLLHPQAGNMIGQSQSGTGKTAAFVLNILSRINLEGDMATKPQALVVVPTRELARQIAQFIEAMGQWLPDLKVNLSVPENGGKTRDAGRMQPVKAPVIVGTPATIFSQMTKKALDSTGVRVLVLDEADVMLENSMRDQCCRIKTHLKTDALQVVLFSATWSDEVERFADEFAPEANRVALPKKSDVVVRDIKQVAIACNAEQRYDCLLKFYGLLATGSSVIFVRTKEAAAEISRRMEAEGYVVGHLTSKNDTKTRDQVIDQFRNGQIKVLIATNVLSRGIDVDTISLVVNFDLPDKPVTGSGGKMVYQADAETYIHRIGRTGRFGRLGVAVSFITSKEDEQFLREAEKRYECDVENIKPNTEGDWEDLYERITKILKDAKRISRM